MKFENTTKFGHDFDSKKGGRFDASLKIIQRLMYDSNNMGEGFGAF